MTLYGSCIEQMNCERHFCHNQEDLNMDWGLDDTEELL